MKLKILLLIFLKTFLFSHYGISLTENEKKYLLNNEPIKIGYSPVFKPLLHKNEFGQTDGILNDLYKLLNQKYGLKYEIIFDTWENTIKNLQSKKIDIIPAISQKTAGKYNFLQAKSIIQPRVHVYSKDSLDKKIYSLNDLEGLKVAYNINIIFLDKEIQKYKDRFILYPKKSSDEVLQELASGNVDVAMEFDRVAYTLFEKGIFDIKSKYNINEKGFQFHTITAFNQDNYLLQSIIHKMIDHITLDEKKKIVHKWLGAKSLNKVTLSTKEQEYIKNNIFTICEHPDIYPLSGILNNKLIGIRGEYINEIVKRTGLKLKVLESKNNDELTQNIQNNKCDIIGSVEAVQKIFLDIQKSDTVMQFPYGVVGDISSFNMGPHSNLKKHKFIVRFQTIKNRLLSIYPDLNIEIINDVDKALSKVTNNTHFVVLKPMAEKIIQKYGYQNYKLNGVFDNIYHKSEIGVHSKHPELLIIINKSIASIQSDVIDKIRDKYSINKFTIQKSYEWLWYIVFILILLVISLQYRYIKNLKKQREREKNLSEELKTLNDNLEYKVHEKTLDLQNTNEQLEKIANFDVLTKLFNRHSVKEQLRLSIKHAIETNENIAVLFIDLDGFKSVNDNFGHSYGDELLQEVASRLKFTIRDSDLLGRLGGDEFVITLFGIKDKDNILAISSKIISTINKPFSIKDTEHFIGASIGISCFPEDGNSTDILLKKADTAMYESKNSGKNCATFFNKSMEKRAHELFVLHNNLKKAIETNQFELYYQPKLDFKHNALVGVEALIRWNHPQHGLVSPDTFIPYAEESRMIIPLGKWVIEKALEDFDAIQRICGNIHISVNVSHAQISDDFVKYLYDLQSHDPKVHEKIKLEITETFAMDTSNNTIKAISKIKEFGFKISLDDFGKGFSALSSINSLQVDEIKIDRSFIIDVPGDKADEKLVASIIAMGKAMDKDLVAEGVETLENINFLIKHKCNVFQGYYISKPLPLYAFIDFVQTNNYKI